MILLYVFRVVHLLHTILRFWQTRLSKIYFNGRFLSRMSNIDFL